MHRLLHTTTTPPPCDDHNATIYISQAPTFWAFKSAQLVLATAALSSNVIVGYTCGNNAALGRSLRRVLLASCLTHAALAAYVFAKSVHAFGTLLLDEPSYLLTTVFTCKIQEAFYLIIYMHCAVVMCMLGLERCRTLYERRRRRKQLRAATRREEQRRSPTRTSTMDEHQPSTILIDGNTDDSLGDMAKVVAVVGNTVTHTESMVSIGTQTGEDDKHGARRFWRFAASPPTTRTDRVAVMRSNVGKKRRRGHSTCTIALLLLFAVSALMVLPLLLHKPSPHKQSPHVQEDEIELTWSTVLPMCTVLLTMDAKLTLCLCSTVLLIHFLAVGIFFLAIALQRRSDQALVSNTCTNSSLLQESSQMSRMHATRQLGKLLLTLIAVWGFVTLTIGIVMLMIMTHILPHLSLGVIYALELFAYTCPVGSAFVHALAIVWLVAPVQTALLHMCPCVVHLVPEATTRASAEHARTIRKQYVRAMRSAKLSEGSHRQPFAQRPKLGTIEEAIEEKPTAKAAITLHSKSGDTHSYMSDISDISFCTSSSSDYLDISLGSDFQVERTAAAGDEQVRDGSGGKDTLMTKTTGVDDNDMSPLDSEHTDDKFATMLARQGSRTIELPPNFATQ